MHAQSRRRRSHFSYAHTDFDSTDSFILGNISQFVHSRYSLQLLSIRRPHLTADSHSARTFTHAPPLPYLSPFPSRPPCSLVSPSLAPSSSVRFPANNLYFYHTARSLCTQLTAPPLKTRPSIHPSINPSIHPSIHPSIQAHPPPQSPHPPLSTLSHIPRVSARLVPPSPRT